MAISELETLVRERIPLVAVIYNDSAYGAEVHHFDADNADLEVVRFPTAEPGGWRKRSRVTESGGSC
jgi:hypothetical protein